MHLFNVAEDVRTIGLNLLTAFAVLMPVKVQNMILGGGIIRSGGRTKYIMMIEMLGTWLIGVPLALLTGNVYLMIPGGFLGAFCDNFLEVKTDVRLNHMIPSEQRATLMSVNSFTFSIVMIVLSPVFGYLFS